MKLFLISVLLLFASHFAGAQNQKLEIGLEGGPNVANVYSNPPSDKGGDLYNYSIGIASQYNLSDRFSIRASFDYEKKGFEQVFGFVGNVNNYPTPYSVLEPNYLNYIALPVMVKATFGNKIHYFFDAGLYVGYLLDATSYYPMSDSSGNFERNVKHNDTSLYHRIDPGICFGTGIGIPAGKNIIIELEGRANFGAFDIQKQYMTGGNTPALINQSASLLLNIRYKI